MINKEDIKILLKKKDYAMQMGAKYALQYVNTGKQADRLTAIRYMSEAQGIANSIVALHGSTETEVALNGAEAIRRKMYSDELDQIIKQ